MDADSSLAWDVSYTSFAHPASQSAAVGMSAIECPSSRLCGAAVAACARACLPHATWAQLAVLTWVAEHGASTPRAWLLWEPWGTFMLVTCLKACCIL